MASGAPDRPVLHLIDGTAYAYRAYHAGAGLRTSDGVPTDAIFGVTMMLGRLLSEQPTHVAIAFDLGGSTYRDEVYREYKAHRPPMPGDLPPQVDAIRAIAVGMGIRVVELSDYEADDILATLARQAEEAGFAVRIYSGDKDMLQLVGPSVQVVSAHRDRVVVYDAEKVKERWGVEPAQIPDVLALVGDTSDNIPGVPGIGEKTAPQILGVCSTIEEVYERLDALPAKWAARLQGHRDTALLSKRLATLHVDVPVPCSVAECALSKEDTGALAELYARYEFRSLLQALQDRIPKAKSASVAAATETTIVTTEEGLEALLRELHGVRRFAVDTETTSLETLDAQVVGVSLAWEPGRAYYIPIGHSYMGAPPQLPARLVVERLRPLLEDASLEKVGHHLKYDLSVLSGAGVALRGIAFDTLLAAYLLNPSATSHKLEAVAEQYLGRAMTPIEELIGKGAKQRSFAEVTIPAAAQYAAEDADVTWQLSKTLAPELEAAELGAVLREIEQPLIPILAEMERTGIRVDTSFLAALSREFDARLEAMESRIHEVAGVQFQVNSPKQLGEVLFDRLGLPRGRRTQTGYSTDVRVLEELAAQHELPALVLDYRSFAKLKGTYVDALAQMVHPRTGRVHTSFNQAIAATGRLSSSNPNLQNIPIRTDEGREIRRAFLPEEGWLLLTADYSQIELRVLAHLSGDERLRRAFAEDRDIHAHTASLVFGVAPEAVTEEMRRRAKAVNFGIIYGMEAFGLATRLKIPHTEAQAFIERYFETYPGVRTYFDRLLERAREEGYVTTITGRRRLIPELRSGNRNIRAFGQRAAMNAPVQGSAADIIKIAMIQIADRLARDGLRARLLLQVHDELVFECPPEEVSALRAAVMRLMEGAVTLSVPLRVDVGVGENWLDAK
jgi:DNA polymerase-1